MGSSGSAPGAEVSGRILIGTQEGTVPHKTCKNPPGSSSRDLVEGPIAVTFSGLI